MTADVSLMSNDPGVLAAREEAAIHIVKNRMWWSAGLGLIWMPFVDAAAVAAIQLTMLHKLCEMYGVEYDRDRLKEWIAALAGGIGPTMVLKRVMPLVGMLTGPIVYGASTYAIGKVFIQHFETGGTLLSFDADRMRSYFAKFYAEGRAMSAPPKPAKA